MTELRAAVHEELKQLDEAQQLTPQNLLDRARDRKSVLHELFEWDNKIAGEKYRLNQARNVIAYYEVKVIVHRTEYRMSEFVERPLKSGKEQGYTSVQTLVSNKQLAIAYIEEQLTVARTYADKTRAAAQILGLIEHVEEAVGAIDAVLNEVRSAVQQPQQIAS